MKAAVSLERVGGPRLRCASDVSSKGRLTTSTGGNGTCGAACGGGHRIAASQSGSTAASVSIGAHCSPKTAHDGVNVRPKRAIHAARGVTHQTTNSTRRR